jgi:triphosphoribosyl-dephospho-CoA synthase
MKPTLMSRAERAQLAMMIEVAAYPKPGNVDRCHDYENTRLEHFLASVIFARPALEEAERFSAGIGRVIRHAVELTNRHAGGNTHFGAFVLLIPLVMGDGIAGASRLVRSTDTSDAIEFYKAFAETEVRVLPGDELDIRDPAVYDELRARGMTLYDVMVHSAPRDMVAREWTNGFVLTCRGSKILMELGSGRDAVTGMFLRLLASEPDTFIAKKHGMKVAERTMCEAQEVLDGTRDLADFDRACIAGGINPGSIADITIAAIYTALGEGWDWEG